VNYHAISKYAIELHSYVFRRLNLSSRDEPLLCQRSISNYDLALYSLNLFSIPPFQFFFFFHFLLPYPIVTSVEVVNTQSYPLVHVNVMDLCISHLVNAGRTRRS
jgi:hypothetical protein